MRTPPADGRPPLWRRIDSEPAPDPAAWHAAYAAPRYDARLASYRLDPWAPEEVTASEVLGGDVIATSHQRLLAIGAPADAAAHYVAGWFAGSLGDAVGFALAGGGHGILLDDRTVRWTRHPDGWVARVEHGDRVIVEATHPWSRRAGVVVVDSAEALIATTMDRLMSVCAPIIEMCRGLARVGWIGLWSEVSDALGMALLHQRVIACTDERLALLRRCTAQPNAPWRVGPRLELVDTAAHGRTHVAQRGGCCLAYTHLVESPTGDLADEDRYCVTCSLQAFERSCDRQLRWLAESHPELT